jgi:Tfp pilus assembly protein PilF
MPFQIQKGEKGVLDIREESETMGILKYFSLVSFVITLVMSGCSRNTFPAKGEAAELQKYDVAQYEYFYVEALKQKLLGNSGDALGYFEQCLKLNPASGASYYQMATIIAASGNTGSARKYALKAVELEGKNLWYLMLLSELYYHEKNIDSTIVWYEKAVKLFPDKENIQLALGNLYIENNKFDKANSIFDSFDRKYGINEASTISSVRSLVAGGKYQEARVKIETLVNDQPGNILYKGLLAEVCSGLGEKERAFGIYIEMMEAEPGNPQIQMSLADFLTGEKMYEELFSLLNTIVLNNDIGPDLKVQFFAHLLEDRELAADNQNRLILAMMVLEAGYRNDNRVSLLRPELLVLQGKQDQAIARLEEVIQQQPGNFLAWERLLFIYFENRDFEKLAKRGGEYATKFNMSFLGKILYAQGAAETGDAETALAELKKAEILAGDNREMMFQVVAMRADVYYKMKDFDKAFLNYEEALKYNNDDLTILNNYAYYLAEQGLKLKEAEELARRVVEKEKNNNTFLDTYGWVLYKRGKLNEAAKVFETIISSNEEPDAEWFEHYGFILRRQKKCEKAIENWKISIKLDPSKTHLLKEIENCVK